VRESIAKQYTIVALADDERLPASLQPMLEDTWYGLAELQMESGQTAAAERSFAAGVKASAESAAQHPEGSIERTWTMGRPPVERALLALRSGDAAAALDKVTASIAELDQIPVERDDIGLQRDRNSALEWMLDLQAESALRLGRYPQAEAAARRRLELLPSIFSNDTVEDKARQQLQLAHALARQGKGAEARDVLAPAMAHYRAGKVAGASGTSFRLRYAEAQLVSALAQEADPAGRRARQQALSAASAELAGVSNEVRQLRGPRELSAWIAAATAKPGA